MVKLKRKWYKTWWIWLIAALILAAVGTLSPIVDVKNTTQETVEESKEPVTIPNVTGKKVDDAEKILEELGLKVEVNSDDGRKVIVKSNWTVESQLPIADKVVDSGSTIVLTVSKPDSAPDPEPEKDSEPETNTDSKERYVISEHAAEVYCQDAGRIGKFINLNDINIIWATNYGKYYSENDGGYDNNGNPIAFLRWNGKYKKSGQQLMFSCWLSGASDNDITLHNLSANGQDLYGTPNFDSYNADGTKRD